VSIANESKPAPIIFKDNLLVFATGFIALALILAIPTSLSGELGALNAALIRAVPLPVAILALGIPFAIYFALHLQGLEEQNALLRERQRRERIRLTGRIIFRSWCRPHIHGSTWDVVNGNRFAWTDTRILIERQTGDELICEKHQLGDVAPGQRITIDSPLQDQDCTTWRIMVLSCEGSQTDFPERGYSRKSSQGSSYVHTTEESPALASSGRA
jgi:hypothetical protein